MPGILVIAACAEILTGLALLVAPGPGIALLFGAELAGLAGPVSRIAGIALIGLGLACWPGPPRLGMLVYGMGVAAFLAVLAISGMAGGVLIWPVIAVHILLSVGLLRSGP